MRLAFFRHGTVGGGHEIFAVHPGSFRGRHLRRKIGRGAKLSVVRLLQFLGRRHELRVRNISTMPGRGERGWREL
jgi:hypothetical protein